MTATTQTLEESLKLVKSVETRRNFATYVPRDGVSLNFLLKHLPNAKFLKYDKNSNSSSMVSIRTMYDLEAYVLQLTARWHCSFTELLKEHPSHQQAVVDTADYFVSFAYATDLETILSALEKYRRKQGSDDIFVWNSILSINQHFGRQGKTGVVEYPKSWFKKAFKECIPAIKKVLFVMSPLAKPVALQRLWCIYELFLSVSNKICTLDVVLSEEDEQYLIDNLLKDSQVILKYITNVNAKEAKSSNPKQEEKLRSQIEEIPGGYIVIDDAVRDRLREWFAHAATGYIEARKEEYKKDRPQYINLLRMIEKMLSEAGRLEEAYPLATEGVAECRAYHGIDHKETATALNNLAQLLHDQGKLKEAEPLMREALGISKKALGAEHPTVASWLNNLAGLLRAQSEYDKAKRMYEESLRIRRKAFGNEHPAVAESLNNLAQLLKTQGKFGEAEPLYRQAMVILENSVGKEHPNYASTLNNLARLFSAKGDYAEAEKLQREAMLIRKKMLGDGHPLYASDLNNLAELLRAQGKYEEAKPRYEEAIAIWKQVHGKEHPLVAIGLNNLAALLKQQGKYDEAEPLFRQALAIDRTVYGNEHPDVAISLNNLAGLLSDQGKLDEAEPLFREALAISRKVYGKEHPDYALKLNNLACLLKAKWKRREARKTGREAVRIAENVLGRSHPTTRIYRRNWGWQSYLPF